MKNILRNKKAKRFILIALTVVIAVGAAIGFTQANKSKAASSGLVVPTYYSLKSGYSYANYYGSPNMSSVSGSLNPSSVVRYISDYNSNIMQCHLSDQHSTTVFIEKKYLTKSTSLQVGKQLVSFANYTKTLGIKYSYGANSFPNFDCSSWTAYTLRYMGLNIVGSYRTAASQYNYCQSYGKKTGRISSSNYLSYLQPGDLVFYYDSAQGKIGHVAIYAGDGYIYHNSSYYNGVVKAKITSPTTSTQSIYSYGRLF